ncbi:MAG: DUF6580 family putative transport protein [archaeon]
MGIKKIMRQKLVQSQLQGQSAKQNLKKAALYFALLGAAVGGRAAFQMIPNVEPMTAIVLLAGALLGPVAGFVFGVNALLASASLVYLGWGPWTYLQALGMGIAGYLGGMIRGHLTQRKAVFAGVLSTILFHVILDSWYAITFFSPLSLITGLPFTITHIISTAGFSLGIPAAKEKLGEMIK